MYFPRKDLVTKSPQLSRNNEGFNAGQCSSACNMKLHLLDMFPVASLCYDQYFHSHRLFVYMKASVGPNKLFR